MGSRNVFVYYSPDTERVPEILRAFVAEQGLGLVRVAAADPAGVCRALKGDAFSAIVPIVILLQDSREDVVLATLEAGADEVLTGAMEPTEQLLRLRMTLRRAD